METLKYPFIFFMAGMLTLLAFSSLVYKTHITKQADNLTYEWILLVILSQSLLLIYGLLNNLYSTYLPAFIILLGLFYIGYIKINYETNNKIEDELKRKNIIDV